MIAIFSDRELKYKIEKMLTHKFNTVMQIKYEYNEHVLMDDIQACDVLFAPDRTLTEWYSGYELCGRIHKKNPQCYVVIVGTNHNEAYHGYLYGIDDYVRADHFTEDMERCLDKIDTKLANKTYIECKVVHSGMVKIDADSIIHVETSNRNILVHTLAEDYISNMSISEMENALPVECFVRTARSHIVNIHKVREVEKEYILTIDSDGPIPLSRKRRDEFMKLWWQEQRCRSL